MLFVFDTAATFSGVKVACASRWKDKIYVYDMSYLSPEPKVSSMALSIVMQIFKFEGS
jgi:hypothetical protein